MEAKSIISSKSDINVAPEKVFNTFFGIYSACSIEPRLFEVFRYASLGGMQEAKGDEFVQDIALLFDQLIDLVAAARALHQESGVPHVDHGEMMNGQEGSGHE